MKSSGLDIRRYNPHAQASTRMKENVLEKSRFKQRMMAQQTL
jgi:hypothetical protein